MVGVWVPHEQMAAAIRDLPGVEVDIGPTGTGPAGAGPTGIGPTGTGPEGSGPAGTRAGAKHVGADEVEFYVPPFFLTAEAIAVLHQMPKLRVVQIQTAGVDKLIPHIRPGVTLCNARGAHDAGTAEWVVAAILASLREFDKFALAQAAERWDYHFTRCLDGSTVLIVGYGSIGRAVEERLAPFDVAVRRVARTARPGVVMHKVSLPSSHVLMRDGIPVTSVARTVVDLARTSPFRSGVVVADSALHGFKVGKAELEGVVRDCARWPGIAMARRVVAFSDALAESPFESIARVAFHDGGLPPPMLQVWIMAPDHAIGRVDFLWDQYATIAEADGAVKYADPDRARQQLKRDAELRRAGYEVVHFTWRDLAADPDQVIRWIKAGFGRSARLRTAR